MAGIFVLLALVFILVVVVGTMLMILLVNHKWGYTPEREKELEEQTERGMQQRRSDDK